MSKNDILNYILDVIVPKSFINMKIEEVRDRERRLELFRLKQLKIKEDEFKSHSKIDMLDMPASKESFQNAVRFAGRIKNKETLKIAIKCFARRRQGQLLSMLISGDRVGNYEEKWVFIPNRYENPFKSIVPPLGEERSSDVFDFWNDLYSSCKVYEPKCLNLAKEIIFPWPWEEKRLVEAFDSYGDGKNQTQWKQDSNHRITFWEPLGIGWVGGGNHSLTSGIVQGVGTVNIKSYYDITPIYERVKCDGEYYIDMKSGEIIAPIADFDIATIFEMGRFLI